jgi:hypothetical protein
LKLKHFVTGVPKSLGQQALRKIRSLEHLPALSSPTRSTAASLKHRRCWAFPTRRPSLRIVVIQEIGGGEGIRTLGTLPRQTPADVWSAMEWLADRQDSNGMICTSA